MSCHVFHILPRCCTMVQNEKKTVKNRHLIIHSGASEWASEWVGGASEWKNRWVSDPVLRSGFFVILDQFAMSCHVFHSLPPFHILPMCSYHLHSPLLFSSLLFFLSSFYFFSALLVARFAKNLTHIRTHPNKRKKNRKKKNLFVHSVMSCHVIHFCRGAVLIYTRFPPPPPPPYHHAISLPYSFFTWIVTPPSCSNIRLSILVHLSISWNEEIFDVLWSIRLEQ